MRARRMAFRGIPLSGITRIRNEHVCPRVQTAARARLEPQRRSKWQREECRLAFARCRRQLLPGLILHRACSRSGCSKECLTLTRSSMCAACAWSFPIGFVLWSLTRRATAFVSENGFWLTEQAHVAEVSLAESQKNTKNNTASIVHAVCISR